MRNVRIFAADNALYFVVLAFFLIVWKHFLRFFKFELDSSSAIKKKGGGITTHTHNSCVLVPSPLFVSLF